MRGKGAPDQPARRVIDLSSLWAGPLCGQLLTRAGWRVIKVESTRRPDGARLGPSGLFDLLHAGQESVALDVATPAGRDVLQRLIDTADVVIEASRPRALQQLGVGPSDGGPQVWLSITGYGRDGEAGHRVAFGDDAAAAGGLVVCDQAGPCFCADAAADPATGLYAAVATLAALATGRRWLLDIRLAGVAAWLAAQSSPGPASYAGPVAEPRARPATGHAPALGQHTDEVIAELAPTGRRRA
jgi:crotonobetainyl-CoA:carnitine CoA-transferase CaiB-like acyl-CoA transferase